MSNSAPDDGVDETGALCVALLRREAGLLPAGAKGALGDAEVLRRPIESFDFDSLSTLELVMAVEDRFNVELEEEAVNACATLGDLAALVRRTLARGSDV